MAYIILVDVDLKANNETGFIHRVCSAMHNIMYEGHEYIAAGGLLRIDDLQTTSDLTSIGTTVELSGIDPVFRTEIDNGSFLKAPIDIRVGLLPDNTNIIPAGTAGFVHRGFCDTPNSTIDYNSGSLVITITTESVFQSLTKIPDLMRCAQSSHEATHNGDKFFTWVASTVQKEKWKTK